MPTPRYVSAVLLAACSHAMAVNADIPDVDRDAAQQAAGGPHHAGALNSAARELVNLYPGARFHVESEVAAGAGGRRIIYGAPMTAGRTAREAAEEWLLAHAGIFSADGLELEELWTTPIVNGRFTAVGYQQYIGGLPVEYGNVRLLVLNEPAPRVVYAAATVAPSIEVAPARMINLDGEMARQIVQAMPLFRGLREWGEPELAIYQGDGAWIRPAVVWKFMGEDLEAAEPRSKSFFVDASTGQLVHVRNEIYRGEISGSVKAWATPGTLPDTAANAPVLHDVGEMRVQIAGAGGAFTSRDGLFSIDNAGTTLIDVGTGVGVSQGFGGKWVNVTPLDVAPVQQVFSLTPPAIANFILNAPTPPAPVPVEHTTAQVNAFLGVTLAHNAFRDRAPNFPAIDVALRVETGRSGACDAFFNPGPILAFMNAGNGCVNTAYSTIIAHEYGHFIVNRLQLGQGGFGEGIGDAQAMLLYDEGIVGRDFYGPGTFLRDPVSANVQYPCPTSGPGSGIHHCGQILGGSWWRLRENLGAAHGSGRGLEIARDLNVGWSLITTGGTGLSFRNSAHPGTVIEVLTIDDDDGYLGNGTPNWASICDAFAAHGIDCPSLDYLDFEFPEGVPSRTDVGQAFNMPVNIIPLTMPAKQGAVSVFHRIREGGSPGGAFIETPAIPIGPDQYTVMLPAASCAAFIDFYFTAETSGGQVVKRPADAPDTFFTARALGGTIESVVFEDDFETDKGWTVWNDPSMPVPGGGHWERVIPIGSFFNNQPVQPGAAFRGQYCYLTENGALGAPVNAHDVDFGPTVLTSPAIDISGGSAAADVAELSFAWWHFTLNGQPDELEVDISADDGINWIRIAAFGNTTMPRHGSWNTARFDLFDHVAPTANLRIRFTVDDTPNDSLTESAIDDVRVIIWQCPALPCYANCNGSTTEPILTVDDFTCFINEFAGAQGMPHEEQIGHYANCDGSTIAPVLTVDDFTCFINAFAQGCQ